MTEMLKTKNIVVIALGLSGLVSGSVGLTTGAVFVAVFLLSIIYCNLRFENGDLLAVGSISAFAILFATSLYVFGQYAQPLSHFSIRVIGFACLIYFSLKSGKSTDRGQYRASCSFAFCFFGITYIFSQIPTAKLISFLGFGYDNYGHFYIFRNTLINRHAFIAIDSPSEFVSFVGATPLGTNNLLSLIADTIGIDGVRMHESLAFFSLAVILMPMLTIFVGYLAIKSTAGSKIRVFVGTLLLTIVVLLAYPSHVWFSGYLTSNFSTFLMITGVCIAICGKPDSSRVWVLVFLGIAQFMVYPLYAVFAIIPFVSLIISGNGQLLVEIYKRIRSKVLGYFALSIYISVLIVITLRGILSGYGGGQFLAPGGIAPLPVGTTMFVFGVSIALAIARTNDNYNDSIRQIIVCGIAALAIAGISYSFLRTNEPGSLWVPSYYPTKLTISVLIVLTTLLIIQMVQKIESGDSKIRYSLNALVVVAAVSALVVSSYNSWPFSQGYMGTTQGVVKSLKDQKSEVVDGESVLQAYESVKNSKLSALYLSDDHESELNTRWINTLNLNWNDVNWGKWMNARHLIDEGKFAEASIIMNGEFILLLDNFSVFSRDPNAFSEFERLCVIDLVRENGCR
jgi:hypothetical protein